MLFEKQSHESVTELTPTLIAVSVAVLLLAMLVASGSLMRMSQFLNDHTFWLSRWLYSPQPPQAVVVISLDDAATAKLNQPLGLSHRAFANAVNAITRASPRAVLVDIAMPNQSYESLQPGAEDALAHSIQTLNQNGPAAFAVGLASNGQPMAISAKLTAAMTEARMGIATWPLDSDQSVRRYSNMFDTNQKPVPLLVDTFAEQLLIKLEPQPINFSRVSHWQTISLGELFEPISEATQQQLNDKLRGKVVVIGSVLPFDDRYKQPIALKTIPHTQQKNIHTETLSQVGALSPGSLLYAQFFETQLTNHALQSRIWIDIGAALILACALVLLTHKRQRLGCITLFILTIASAPVAAHLLHQGYQWHYAYTLIFAWLAVTLQLTLYAIKTNIERSVLKRAFSGYVSPAVMGAILTHRIDPTQPTRTNLAFMFIDLRDSSMLTQELQPERMVVLLNEFFASVVDAVHAHEGVVDNFRGDGLMAFFGAPTASQNPVALALAALDELYANMQDLNRSLNDQHLPMVRVTVGLSFGEAVVANVGSKKRNNYTAIGGSVNEAARLQEVAKHHQGEESSQLAAGIPKPWNAVMSVAVSDTTYNEALKEGLHQKRARMTELNTLNLRGIGERKVYIYQAIPQR